MNIPKMEAEIQSVTILEPPNRAWYSKMIEYFKRNRNQVEPVRFQLEHCEFFKVAPRRTLRVLKPELKSGHYYEAQSSSERPESINDNFYARWARRPHPSGNCRCSFRQSTNSSRLSSHEEKIISQEIQRIRTSLCEAEKSGRNIEELEKSLTVDLTQLQLPSNDKTQETESQRNSINDNTNKKQSNGTVTTELLAECTKKKIVKDLDRYISDLLDEILNDTIKAIAKADNPFNRERKKSTTIASTQPQATTSFDISFAFHNSDDGDQKVNDSKDKIVSDELNAEDKGYINKGYLGSTSDPDALDFHLRPRMNGNAILENADCIDSGINSVETIELQPEQEQNLEQSLIDIIDAKLGGTSIGKSLENLGMEIDATDDAKISEAAEPTELRMPNDVILEKKTILSTEAKKSTTGEKKVTIKESPVFPAEERTSKSLDDAIEEPFNSLRLEFNKRDVDASKQSDGKQSTNVTFKVNKTMSVIRKRITTRLGNSRRKSKNNNNDNNTLNKSCSSSKSSTRASLELEDYRKRFPVPDTNRHRFSDYDDIHEISDEVTLRNRNRKPMIVFLHGFGSSAESFGHQLQYFANLGYPCIAPDLLGHGVSSASNRRKDYHFDKLLKDLETVLQHYAFKPGQKCVLVAHNYGCSFATALANKYSSNVHQLVLISGGGPTPLAPPAIEGPAHCCLRASLAPFLVCGIHRGILYSARGRQHPYCGDELHEDQWPSHMRHVLCGMSWPEGDYVFHRRICTPTLLVHGLRDDKVSLVQECQMERTMLKVYLEAIPAAGHMPMTDCPEQLNHMIHCFIDLWKNKKW